LSQPGALQEVVAGLIERGEVDAGKIDAADPLGFLRERADVGSLTEAAYRFCRHEPGAEVILTGTGNVEHLEANLAAIQGPPARARDCRAVAGAVWRGGQRLR
jgi:L-galactose dehydrogenase